MSASPTRDRATFRPIIEGAPAWQRQLRDRFAAEGVPAGVPHVDVRQAIVRPVSYRFAENIILRYEWLGSMAKTNRHFGIFFGNVCAGVTCVAVGGAGTAGANTHRQFQIARNDLAVLSRGACTHWAPPGANSKLVSWTCRLLEREGSARLIMAFADTDAGEIGTIYQAANWVYIGRSRWLKTNFVAPNGRSFNRNVVAHVRRANGVRARVAMAALRRDGWIEQPPNPKHRYVYVLDRADHVLLARVELKRLPFPKREL